MEQRIELAPNCSLTAAGAKLFFGATCLFSLAFALLFVLQGFWPVLPFWALEMLALGLALNASMRRRRYTQTLLITDSLVSRGLACEVGSFLTEEERCLLAKRLGRLVGGMNESPPMEL